jgi:hypothetical protein
MGWEFAAVWNDDADAPWQWIWRRIADDSGQVIEESRTFGDLEACMADAKHHGFEDDGESYA